MLPLPSMTEQQRENQYQANMTQLNNERLNRNETAGTRDNWYATHVATHGSLFPFVDNVTTLMFIAASDVNEAQRERFIQSKQSLWNYSVCQKSRWRVPLSV